MGASHCFIPCKHLFVAIIIVIIIKYGKKTNSFIKFSEQNSQVILVEKQHKQHILFATLFRIRFS